MQLVNSKEEIEEIRPYKEYYNLTKFPRRFPAFVDFLDHDGGLMGDYYTMEILEIPDDIKCPESFITGVIAGQHGIETYSESIFERKQ